MSNSSKRSRGAQPGNINAVKHGYYALSLRIARKYEIHPGELLADVNCNINALRALMRRIVAETAAADEAGEPLTIDQTIASLRALSLAAIGIARLSATAGALSSRPIDPPAPAAR